MFTYPAGTWTPASAAEHSVDILNNINAVLQANNIRDSSGNLIQFAASLGNIVWIMALALGNMRADDDAILLAASQEFSISEESDAQLLATLPMTGTTLIPGAYSLVTLAVTADASGATVPVGTKAALGTICNFLVLATTTIGSGSTAMILCQSDTIGPIAVAPGQLTSFATTIPHVVSVTNPAGAVVGRNVETTQQLRQRLLAGNVINTNLDGTRRAILSIQGITQAVIYLNTSPTGTLALQGGVNIPPLSTYIVVAGLDLTGLAIAAAYASRMLIQTYAVGPGPTYTRTDLTFLTGDNSVNTAGGNFVTAGFVANQWVTITGSVSNNFTFMIGTVTASKITAVAVSVTFVAEADANSITLAVKNVQVYTTGSGQLIPVLFDYAANQNIYVQVFYELGSATVTGFDVAIKNIVAAMAWTIGQPVTAALVLQALTGFSYARITGAQVSTDNATWKNEVYPNGNALPYIAVGNIAVAAG